jgi:hypothetical protein
VGLLARFTGDLQEHAVTLTKYRGRPSRHAVQNRFDVQLKVPNMRNVIDQKLDYGKTGTLDDAWIPEISGHAYEPAMVYLVWNRELNGGQH